MRAPQSHSGKARQRGVALLVMLIILVIGFVTLLVKSLTSADIRNERQAKTSTALAQAKSALIGYAITYGDTHTGEVHGYLPCPDLNGGNPEGSAEANCGSKNVSQLGRLPWKTLDLSPLRDGDGECLWYAISGTYKNNPKTDMMNWDTNGQLHAYAADGITRLDSDDNQVVAVIFAPGAPREGQDRSGGSAPVCGGNYTASAYLDDDTTHSINNTDIAAGEFVLPHEHRDMDGNVIYSANDQFVYITRQDIWNAMLKRNDFMTALSTMTQKATECLADYGRRNNAGASDKRLPWSGRFWPNASDYLTDSNYDDEDGRLAGRLPYRVNSSDSDSSNQIVSPYYQLTSDGSNCPSVADWATYHPWWTNWKDHLFYALADDFKPSGGSSSCGTCLKINSGGDYAAVVMFAGKQLAGQTRTLDSDRLDFSNYLEGRNFTNGSNSSGDADYQSGAATGSFNDILYCINPNLTVTPC